MRFLMSFRGPLAPFSSPLASRFPVLPAGGIDRFLPKDLSFLHVKLVLGRSISEKLFLTMRFFHFTVFDGRGNLRRAGLPPRFITPHKVSQQG